MAVAVVVAVAFEVEALAWQALPAAPADEEELEHGPVERHRVRHCELELVLLEVREELVLVLRDVVELGDLELREQRVVELDVLEELEPQEDEPWVAQALVQPEHVVVQQALAHQPEHVVVQ